MFGIFSETGGVKRRAEATYSKTGGGIRIAYPIPRKATAGQYKAEIFVQKIGSSQEEILSVDYEIVP